MSDEVKADQPKPGWLMLLQAVAVAAIMGPFLILGGVAFVWLWRLCFSILFGWPLP